MLFRSASSLPTHFSIPPTLCFIVGIPLDFALIPFFGASGAAAAASAGYLAAGASAVLIYRARVSFPLRELVVPQAGDFAVLRTLAPVPRAPLARRGAQ